MANPLTNPHNHYMLLCEIEYNRLLNEVADTVDEKGWKRHYPVVGLMYCEVVCLMGREFIRWMYNVRLMPNDPLEDVIAMADDYYRKCWLTVIKYAGQYQGAAELRKEN